MRALFLLALIPSLSVAMPWRLSRRHDLVRRAVDCGLHLYDAASGRVGRARRAPSALQELGRRFEWYFGYFAIPPNLAQRWEARDRALFGRLPAGTADALARCVRLVWWWDGRLSVVIAVPSLPATGEFEEAMRRLWRPRLEQALAALPERDPTVPLVSVAGSRVRLEARLAVGGSVAVYDANAHGDHFEDGEANDHALYYVQVQGADHRPMALDHSLAIYERLVESLIDR